MNTSTRRDRLRAEQKAQAEQQRRRLRTRRILGLGSLLIVAAAIAAMLATSQNVSSTDAHVAPPFTLATTAGTTVSLPTTGAATCCSTSTRVPAVTRASCR